jgi:outer membrane lipoprotein SlyB
MRPACVDCGRVERIERVAAIRATASGGAVLGGVVGGVISAPAPGAPANASASGAPRPPQGAWRIHLRMDDGRRLVVHQNLIAAGLAVGSRVRLVQGRLVPVH